MGNPLDDLDCVFVNGEKISRSEACERAVFAISARINGVWDNPYLVAFGDLSDDTKSDILEILEFYGVG